ncbi:uroporphyrinogen decarboxylase [Kocuria sp. HSID16901]|uniref:uroporphyrinogen decarboxylase n=1 Tax=Kocuria sp. HSID16901 TaxID=2419505 RepID=UPI0009E59E8E|nr:uroporphyrinogen decarboxylase [Kocuria sp. HSID16901]MCT1367511.1 uroporphyrinogen decarboxylase [Rothia sp. p3-SID1597]
MTISTPQRRALLTDAQLSRLAPSHPLRAAGTAHSPMIRAMAGDRPEHPPVWFMRQAGRSLPEYRAAREGTNMLEACLDPELAAEITVQPVRRHGVDAAIFFSDIVVPLKIAGVDVDIVPGRGPVMGSPYRELRDIESLPEIPDEAFDPIREAVGRAVDQLGSTPLIGFAGAPFTVAAYMAEGGSSRDHLGPRTMMHRDPEAWNALASWVARVSGQFLAAQVEAGASAVQLFDSWAGSLSERDYRAHVMHHSALALEAVESYGVPRVHFGTGSSELLVAMKEAGGDVVGVDYRLDLDEATRRLGPETPVQGNIDPAMLDAGWEVLQKHTVDVLSKGRDAAAHIVNLGHGVPPSTDPTVLTRLVEFIHES